jgi:hypothetical protein
MNAKDRQPAMARAVNALTRALGGATVKLRVATTAVEGLERELGLTATSYEELELSPVIWRYDGMKKEREQMEMLVSSNALDLLMPASVVANGLDFLKRVQAIEFGERVYVVTEVSAERFAGVEYLYRVKAQSAVSS